MAIDSLTPSSIEANCSSSNRAWVAVGPSSVKAFGRSSVDDLLDRRRAGDRHEVHRVSMLPARVRIGSKQRSLAAERRVWALWETACCAVFHGVHTLVMRASFEGGRTNLANRRMTTPLVIEHFDVIEQCHLRVATAVEPIGELRLDCREEALHHRVVVAVAAAAHAADDAARVEDGLIILARVGTALVRVMEQTDLGAPAFEGHLERLEGQMPVVHRTDCPPPR